MKKALIICYDFPPLPSVGSQRPFSWSKNFYSNNIFPIVITRKWKDKINNVASYFEKDSKGDEIEESSEKLIIKCSYKGNFKSKLFSSNFFINVLRRIITVFEHLLKWKMSPFDESYFLYEKSRSYLLQNKIDFILVSGQPFTLFKYAYKLSKEFDVPYVLDYRDGWSTDHAVKSTLLKLISFQEKKLEEKYLKGASFFTAASDNIIKENKKLFPFSKGFLHENGIDLSLLNELKKERRDRNPLFTITFTGSLYNQHNVRMFIDGVEKFMLENESAIIKVKFVGINLKPSDNTELVNKFQLKYPNSIEVIEAVSHMDSIRYQLSSSLLLKFDYTGQHQGMLGAKLYEYAATKKPILTVLSIRNKETTFYPGRNIQYMVTSSDEIVKVVKLLYVKHSQGEIIESDLSDDEIFSFSREHKIKELTETIYSNI
ncbi:hypothetical protein N9242_05450 [Vicingaceae bacterium]|nr:hypothetical protein [Vicingaceae bacterium]